MRSSVLWLSCVIMLVLSQDASLEVNNEIKGMNKQRFTNALQKEGYDNVRFYNPDGALGVPSR